MRMEFSIWNNILTPYVLGLIFICIRNRQFNKLDEIWTTTDAINLIHPFFRLSCCGLNFNVYEFEKRCFNTHFDDTVRFNNYKQTWFLIEIHFWGKLSKCVFINLRFIFMFGYFPDCWSNVSKTSSIRHRVHVNWISTILLIFVSITSPLNFSLERESSIRIITSEIFIIIF